MLLLLFLVLLILLLYLKAYGIAILMMLIGLFMMGFSNSDSPGIAIFTLGKWFFVLLLGYTVFSKFIDSGNN